MTDETENKGIELDPDFLRGNFTQAVVENLERDTESIYPNRARASYVDRDQGYFVMLADDTLSGAILPFSMPGPLGRAAMRRIFTPREHDRPRYATSRWITADIFALSDIERARLRGNELVSGVHVSFNGYRSDIEGSAREADLATFPLFYKINYDAQAESEAQPLSSDAIAAYTLVIRNLKAEDLVVDGATGRTKFEVERDSDIARQFERIVELAFDHYGPLASFGRNRITIHAADKSSTVEIQRYRFRASRHAAGSVSIGIAERTGDKVLFTDYEYVKLRDGTGRVVKSQAQFPNTEATLAMLHTVGLSAEVGHFEFEADKADMNRRYSPDRPLKTSPGLASIFGGDGGELLTGRRRDEALDQFLTQQPMVDNDDIAKVENALRPGGNVAGADTILKHMGYPFE